MKAGAEVVVLVRVVVGEVREGRGGERGPLVLALPLPLPVTPLGPAPVPAPGGGRRLAVEDISLRGMRGVSPRGCLVCSLVLVLVVLVVLGQRTGWAAFAASGVMTWFLPAVYKPSNQRC